VFVCFCIILSLTLNVAVIGQVDINRELVSLLSTGPLTSFCLLFYSLILCCIDANKLVLLLLLYGERTGRAALLPPRCVTMTVRYHDSEAQTSPVTASA